MRHRQNRYELLAVPAPPSPRPVARALPCHCCRPTLLALLALTLLAVVVAVLADRLLAPPARAAVVVEQKGGAVTPPRRWHAPRDVVRPAPRLQLTRPARLASSSRPPVRWSVELGQVDGALALVALAPVDPPGRVLTLRYGEREVALRAGARRGRTILLRAARGQRFPPGVYRLGDRDGETLARMVLGGDGARARLAAAMRRRLERLGADVAAGRDRAAVERDYRFVVSPWRLCPVPGARQDLLAALAARAGGVR